MKQSEFPSWINNKEYTQNYSPYNTVNQGMAEEQRKTTIASSASTELAKQ
jgi:hypothetical protein